MDLVARVLSISKFFLVENLQVTDTLLSSMESDDTLLLDDSQRIMAGVTFRDKATLLVDTLKLRGPCVLDSLFKAVERNGQTFIKLHMEEVIASVQREGSQGPESQVQGNEMDPVHKSILKRNQVYLLDNLKVDLRLLTALWSTDILTTTERDSVQAKESADEKAVALGTLLLGKDDSAFPGFLRALEMTGQLEILTKLRKDEEAAKMGDEAAVSGSASSTEGAAITAATGSGSATTTTSAEEREVERGTMDVRHKDLLEREKSYLMEHLTMTLAFLVHLVNRGIISSDVKDVLFQPLVANRAKVAMLLEILVTMGSEAFPGFLEALSASEQVHIRAHLEQGLSGSDVGSSGAAAVISEAAGGEVSGSVEEAADDLAAVLARLGVRGSDVNSADLSGRTGLHLAARYGLTDDARTLIRAGANIDARDVFGSTPLHWACGRGHTSIVHALVAGGADTQIRNRSGYTPRDLAWINGHAAILELLPP